MTAIVTADQIVPALTTDLASSTEAEKAALRTALGTGSGGGGTSTASSFFTEIGTSKTFSSAQIGDFTGQPVVTPIEWDSTIQTATFGSMNSARTTFTFSATTVATITFGVAGFIMTTGNPAPPLPANISLSYRLRIGGAGGTTYYGGAAGVAVPAGLFLADDGGSMTRTFNAGDTVEIVMIAKADNKSILTGYYGYYPNESFKSYLGIASH